MNLPALVFALVAFSVLKFMIIGDLNGQPEELEFDMPNIDACPFDDPSDCEFVSPECSNPLFLCIDYLGDVLFNIGIVFVRIATFIFEILTFMVALFLFLGQLAIRSLQPLDSAPWYVNILLLTPQTFLLAMIVFTLIRSGDD